MGAIHGRTTQEAMIVMEITRIAQKHGVEVEIDFANKRLEWAGDPSKKEAVFKELRNFLKFTED